MSSHALPVPEPVITDRYFTKPLMCGPGPCDVWPSVTEALTKPVMSPACEEYYEVMADIRKGIQYLFQTRSELVLAVSGSGHAGMETIITNLLAPGEVLLIPSRGMWDERAADMARRYGIKTEVIKTTAPFSSFQIEEIEPVLRQLRPAGLFITHGDSSTGTVQNIQGLGDLCHKYGTLLLVDVVVSIGAIPFLMDKWAIDAVYASCQKSLGGPAGICSVAFSALAEEKIFRRRHDPPFYFDVKLLSQQWSCYERCRVYHHTLSPPLVWALRCCLEELISETLPKSWARHAATTAHFHMRAKELGLQFLVKKPEDRLVPVTTFELPQTCDHIKFVNYLRANHDIMIAPGLGPTAGRAIRVGLMGVNSSLEVADRLADALADTIRALEYQYKQNYT